MTKLGAENTNQPVEREDRVQKYITTIAGYALAAILAVAFYGYKEVNDRMKTVEDRVSFLYQDKVSRAEFREEMTQVRMQIEGTKADIIARQEAMKSDIASRQESAKSDILSRIDFLANTVAGNKGK